MKSKISRNPIATVALVGLVALTVAALAWPRLMASIRFRPVDLAM